MAVAAVCPDQRRLQSCHRTWGEIVLIAVLSILTVLPVRQLCAFPSSLSDCQTPTGWNCSGKSTFLPQDLNVALSAQGYIAGLADVYLMTVTSGISLYSL